MPTKPSQITPSTPPPATTDSFFGVTAAGADVLFSYQQVSARPPNTQTGTAYTLALTDAGGIVEMNNASASTVTIPPHSSVPFIVGTELTIVWLGAGQPTIQAGSGVTLLPGTTSVPVQYSGLTIYQNAIDSWVALQ